MMKSLRISGVYDQETLKLLCSQNIYDIGFDQRPTSFNFVQGHVVEECLQSEYKTNAYFHFANEKEFIINSFLERMRKYCSSEKKNYLEFSDEMPLEYYESFKTPFVWHFKKTSDYQKILKSKWLSALSLDNDFLNELERTNELFSFLNELFKSIKENNKKIELSLNWNSDISNSLLDFYHFDSIHFEINPLIETTYRHIDIGLLSSSITHTKSILDI